MDILDRRFGNSLVARPEGVGDKGDGSVVGPIQQCVGAVTLDQAGLNPAVALLLDQPLGLRPVDPHAGNGGEEGSRLFQGVLDGEIIQGLHADSIEISKEWIILAVSSVHRARVVDDPVHVGIVAGGARVKRAPDAVREVVGIDDARIAFLVEDLLDLASHVVELHPGHVVADVESIDQSVVGNLPVRGHAGLHLTGLLVQTDQAREELHANVDGTGILGQRGVESGHILVTDIQDEGFRPRKRTAADDNPRIGLGRDVLDDLRAFLLNHLCV